MTQMERDVTPNYLRGKNCPVSQSRDKKKQPAREKLRRTRQTVFTLGEC